MTIEVVRAFLGWCTLINIAFLLWWSMWILFAHDWVYRQHTRWFKMPVETFDAIHYGGAAFFKIIVIVFNLIPYVALRIVT